MWEERSIEQCGNCETKGNGCVNIYSLGHEKRKKPCEIVEDNQ